MNKNWVLYHLKEALEELERTIREIEAEAEYEEPEFTVAITHLYSHLNTAWNSQNASDQETSACSEENYSKWRQFPSGIEM